MADARLNIGVSADAKQASATFKELAADIKSVGKESVGVTEGVAKVDAAMQKLAKAPDTPRALGVAIAKARVEIEDFRAALEKTPASAEKMKAINAALAQADQAIQASTLRAGRLKDAMGDSATQMGVAGKGAEALAGSFGSLQGILGKMADSTSATSQNIAKLGFSLMAAGQAFKFGYEEGEQFRKVMEEIGIRLPSLSDGLADMIMEMDRFRSSTDQTVTAGTVLKDTIFNLVTGTHGLGEAYRTIEAPESAAMERARQIISLREQQAAAEATLSKAMQASGVVWKDAEAERAKTVAQLNAIEMALARTGKSEEAYGAAVRENSKVLLDVAKAANEQGIALDKVAPRTAAAAAEAQRLADAQKAVAAATKATSTSLQEEVDALNKAVEAAVRMRQQAEADGAAQRDRTTATEASERAQRTWNEATHDGVTEMNGWVGVQGAATRVYLQIAEASKEATKALLDQALATKALREEQAQSLEAAKGWTDYVIALKEGYESGTTSLTTYIGELARFRAQLLQIFGGVTGKAKEELQAMIDLITKLISTAGAGGIPTGPGGYADQFQRDANGG